MRRRVRDARVARLATVAADGHPHIVPCCFVLRENTLYSAVDQKKKSTVALRRLANIAANPHAALLVDYYTDDDWSTLWWVRVDGSARVVERGDERERAIDALAEKYEQYVRVRPDGAVIAIAAERWRGWRASVG